jgi:hypothetical protein
MRISALVAAISVLASGSIISGDGGSAAFATSSGRPSHWSVLKTVKRLRNGMVWASSPVSTAFPLSNVATEGESLPERNPTLPGKAALNDGTPLDQDIDPGTAPIGGRVLRHGERRAGCRRSPPLDPGHPARFQLGDDLVGKFLIKPRPAVTGTGAGC